MTDPDGHLYQIEFDPPSNPEMATGAEIIGTAFYHAFGYHTVDVYLAELDPDASSSRRRRPSGIRSSASGVGSRGGTSTTSSGGRRASRMASIACSPAASPTASRSATSATTARGPTTRTTSCRTSTAASSAAARVFGAWLNHDDSRGINSLDMLVQEQDRRYVKHYMFDFGSIMGSGTVYAQRHRPGNEYILEWKPGWLTLATLGVYTRPWMHISYPDVPPAVGRFEAEAFQPELWKPEYPNPAFDNMRPDDAFWAARIVARFDDAAVRAIVEKARYTDPARRST